TGEMDKLFNFISGFNIEPLENFRLNGVAGTNFSGMAFSLDSSYLHSFNKGNSNEDQLRVSGSLRNVGNNYFRTGISSQNSYRLGAAFSHNSGLSISSSYSSNSIGE